MESEKFTHRPVLLDECIDALAIKPNGCYADLTLGRAGHSREIARRLTDGGRLYGVDRDETAIVEAGENLREFADRVELIRCDFRFAADELRRRGVDSLDGVLMDLGVSSPQLDDASRGFSYMADAKLDMRMDRSASLSAYEVVNDWDEAELARILRDYGEERFSGRIAAEIVRSRPIETTFQLVDAIKRALPAAAKREAQHPAKRSFQAIRIATNDELGALRDGLESIFGLMAHGGRMAVISFHSLEDRIVKNFFSDKAKGCICPPDFPVCVCGHKPEILQITKKPIVSGERELNENPRARSAKLRVGEKI